MNNNNNNNNDNIDEKMKEGSESLLNGQYHAKTEDKEEDDIVSDLPLFSHLRRLSHSKTTGDDRNGSYRTCDAVLYLNNGVLEVLVPILHQSGVIVRV